MLTGAPGATEDVAYFAEHREARAELFHVIARLENREVAVDVLLAAISMDGRPSHWMFRKRCVETLLDMSTMPLLVAFNVLVCAKDPWTKNLASKKITESVAFPLSLEARQEVCALGKMGGQLLQLLLTDAPVVGEKPMWLFNYPRLVRSWILACCAAGVESGIGREELQKFDRVANGPLNTWHIDRAVAPLTMPSWSWAVALMRKALRR